MSFSIFIILTFSTQRYCSIRQSEDTKCNCRCTLWLSTQERFWE